MISKSQLLQFLRIKEGEVKKIILTFLFAFCLGITQNILYSIPLALFLSHYSGSALPYIYIGVGIATFIIGTALSYLSSKVTMFYFLAIPVFLFSGFLCIFWGLLFFIDAPWVFIILLIAAYLICSIVISFVALMSNRLFSLQQSKRIYGLVFSCMALGGLLVGFGMDFLVKFIGSKNLILAASILLFLGVLILWLIRKNSRNRLDEADATSQPNTSKSSFSNSQFIGKVFLLNVFVCYFFYSFDLIFNTAVKERFVDLDAMAAFYGVMFACYDIVGLFVGLFIYQWLLSAFGLTGTLILFPAVLLSLLALLGLTHQIPSLNEFFFPILLITAVFMETISESVVKESILLLFQPLSIVKRMWAQVKNETMIAPLSIVFVGGALLAINHYFKSNFIFISFTIIFLCIGAGVLVFFSLKGDYLKVLLESVSKRVLVNPQFAKLDKDTLSVLKSHLKSPYPEEIIYILQTIEDIDKDHFEQILLQTLDRPIKDVQCFCVNKIEQYRFKSAEDQLKTFCLNKKDPDVLGASLLALGSICNLEQFPWFKSYINDANVVIASCSIIAMIRHGSEEFKKEAIDILSKKAVSSNDEDRLIVAHVLKKATLSNQAEWLLPLLKDTNLEARLLASEAAANVVNEKLFLPLIENLSFPHLCSSAINSLQLLGEPLLDFILNKFDEFSPNIQLHLIKVLGEMKSDKGKLFLQQLLSRANRKIFFKALLSLRKLSYNVANREEKIVVKRLLHLEFNNIIILRKIISSIADERAVLLHNLLCREIELSQECCFLLLGFIYDSTVIEKVQYGLCIMNEDSNSNAIELLLQILDKSDRKLPLEQLNYFPYEEKGQVSDNIQIEKLLEEIITYSKDCFIPELLASIVYTIGALRLKTMIEFVRKQKIEENPLMGEILQPTLQKLELA